MKKIGILLVGFLLMMSVGLAGAATIDFEDYQTRSTFYDLGIEDTYHGFDWLTAWAFARITQRVEFETIVPVSGTSYAWNWGGPQSLFIDFGVSTDFNSAYFGHLGTRYDPYNATTIQAFGYDSGDNLVASSAILDLTDSFQILNANFENIFKVEFKADAAVKWFLIDDIVYNSEKIDPVPEPATMLLFGLGLLGLAGVNRRRK